MHYYNKKMKKIDYRILFYITVKSVHATNTINIRV